MGRGVRVATHSYGSAGTPARFGVRDRDLVAVTLDGHGRNVIFGDVVVRVSPLYRLELHLDTDEGNAAGIQPGDTARLVGKPRHAAAVQ